MASGDIFGFTDNTPDPLKKPEVPPPDYQTEATAWLSTYLGNGWWTGLIAAILAGIQDLVIGLVTVLAKSLDLLMASLAPLFLAAQNTNQPEFNALLVAIVGDLLGLELDPNAVQIAAGDRGPLAAMQTIGGSLIDTLQTEFTQPLGGSEAGSTGRGAGGILPGTSAAQGLDGAKRFVGFLLAFAIRAGNVSVLTEMASVGLVKNFREYGEVMARNLGLGRLARQALRPLFQILVADPMTIQLNKQWRPKLLSEGQAVRAYNRNIIDAATLGSILASIGYPDGAQRLIIDENTLELSEGQIFNLMQHGAISHDEAIKRLQNKGYSSEVAELVLTEQTYALQDELDKAYLAVSMRLLGERFLDPLAINDAVDKTGLPDAVKQAYRLRAGTIGDSRYHRLTLAEMQSAFLQGDIDISTFRDFVKQEGYKAGDANLLELELLQKQTTADSKAQAAATKAAAAAAKKAAQDKKSAATAAKQAAGATGQPLSPATWEAGYVNGTITEDQYTQFLTDYGYSQAGIAILLGQARLKKQQYEATHHQVTQLLDNAPGRELTLTQISDIYTSGVRDKTWLDTALVAAGLSDADRSALEDFLTGKAKPGTPNATAGAGVVSKAKPKKLSLAEAVNAYVLGSWTRDQLTAWLKQQGYSDADSSVLLDAADARLQAAQDRAARQKPLPGEPGSKVLTLAQVEAAFLGDALSQQDVADYLQREGYTAADAATLLDLLLEKKRQQQIKAGAAPGAAVGVPIHALDVESIEAQYLNGHVDLAGYQAALHQLGYAGSEVATLTQGLLIKQFHLTPGRTGPTGGQVG